MQAGRPGRSWTRCQADRPLAWAGLPDGRLLLVAARSRSLLAVGADGSLTTYEYSFPRPLVSNSDSQRQAPAAQPVQRLRCVLIAVNGAAAQVNRLSFRLALYPPDFLDVEPYRLVCRRSIHALHAPGSS
jgi:hypothetical protein